MRAEPLLRQILTDEAVTRQLGDPEARILIEWLVDQIETLCASALSDTAAAGAVSRLRRRARAIGCFVSLWCHEGDRRGAVQLAAVERFAWPFPPRGIDPCELMASILRWEAQMLAAAAA